MTPAVSDPPAAALAPGAPATPPMRYYGPTAGWRLIDVGELWRHRELLVLLAAREVKVKYRQAVVGLAWVVIQPLSTALVYVVLFGLLGKTPDNGRVAYGVFLLPGVLVWQLFANIVTQSTQCLVANQHLIGKVYFPRLLLPLSAAGTALVDFLVGLVVLAVVMACYGVAPSWTVLLTPVFALLALLAGLAVGVWAAALNAIYRDVGFLVPFLLQLGFFVTPVIYAADAIVPPAWQPLVWVNPMTGVTEGFRWAALGVGPPPWSALPAVVGIALTLTSGLFYFRRVDGYLADRI